MKSINLIVYSLALLWLYNGMMPPLAARDASLDLLAQLGIAHGWDWLLFISASLWDIALGIALLIPAQRYQHWLWMLQILTTSLYSLIIAIGLPQLWLHPFAPLVKNLPILAIMVYFYRNLDRWKPAR